MDWVWTDTTLSLSDWMCVEDIYANIFIIKCNREMEKVGLHGRGGSMVELGLQESSRDKILLQESCLPKTIPVVLVSKMGLQ